MKGVDESDIKPDYYMNVACNFSYYNEHFISESILSIY